MIKKLFMFSAVIVLVFLIIITPTFISREPPIGSFPRVLIDHMKYSVLVDVRAAVEDYRYENISIRISPLDNDSYQPSPVMAEEIYGLSTVVLKNNTREFELNITLFDRNHKGYDYNATIVIENEQDGGDMLVRKEGNDQYARKEVDEIHKDTLVARSVVG